MDDFGRVLAEIKPDAVHTIQPETNYEATYSALAPKAALETLIRLACLDAGVNVEIVHRASVRSALGGGEPDELIEAKIEGHHRADLAPRRVRRSLAATFSGIIGIWNARDERELCSTVNTLPLAPWMTISITGLTPHPLELEDPGQSA